MEAYAVPFRRPPGWLPLALALLAGAVATQMTGIAIRTVAVAAVAPVEALPPVPHECPSDPGCEAFALSRAPTVSRVFAARSVRLEDQPTEWAEPPPEWDVVHADADRRFLGRILAEAAGPVVELPAGEVEARLAVARAGARMIRSGQVADLGPDTASALDALRYASLLEAAWVATLEDERQRVHDETALRRAAAIEAARARDAALQDARWPRPWEWALLAAAVAATVGAAAHRALRYGPVSIDGHAIRTRTRRLLWEDLAAVTWSTDEVVLVARDGVTTRVPGVELVEFDVRALQRLSDRLLRGRAAAAVPSDAAGELAALIGRAAR